MRQNESKETAAASTSNEKAEKPLSPSTSGGGKSTSAPSAPTDEMKLTRTTSVQEEEPLVSAALNMDISTGTF